jgi:hypothetical protein
MRISGSQREKGTGVWRNYIECAIICTLLQKLLELSNKGG